MNLITIKPSHKLEGLFASLTKFLPERRPRRKDGAVSITVEIDEEDDDETHPIITTFIETVKRFRSSICGFHVPSGSHAKGFSSTFEFNDPEALEFFEGTVRLREYVRQLDPWERLTTYRFNDKNGIEREVPIFDCGFKDEAVEDAGPSEKNGMKLSGKMGLRFEITDSDTRYGGDVASLGAAIANAKDTAWRAYNEYGHKDSLQVFITKYRVPIEFTRRRPHLDITSEGIGKLPRATIKTDAAVDEAITALAASLRVVLADRFRGIDIDVGKKQEGGRGVRYDAIRVKWTEVGGPELKDVADVVRPLYWDFVRKTHKSFRISVGLK